MPVASPEQALFEAIATVGKSFASPRRLEVIDLLSQAPRTVEELAGLTGQSLANTSQHLQQLHRAGVVQRERQGTHVQYKLAGCDVAGLWLALRDLAATRLPEVERAAERYLGGPVEEVALDGLESRIGDGDVVLLDVRPEGEYAAGHIEGARSIPVAELRSRIDELPNGAQVVAYCRGRYCAMSRDAVRLLRSHGYAAAELEEGALEWLVGGRKLVAS